MNQKEQKYLKVVSGVIAGHMTGQQAAELLGLSLRQVRRLVAGYRRSGVPALAHGNRGRASPRRTAATVQAEVVRLAKGEYRDYNHQHFQEELAERHQLCLSVSTVRRIRHGQGLASPRKRRSPRHRSRRARYPQAGMLLQVDGSRHDWLEGRGPWLTLVSAIDDATNEVPAAHFRQQEDAAGYFHLLRAISQSHGLPAAVYADRHTIFQSPKRRTIEEELAGASPRSQVGRLLDELHIELIPAYSPQAKGRVERLFGTFQDRLVKELRRAQATTLEEANQALAAFLPRFNRRFQRLAAQPGSVYRPWPDSLDPDRLFCFQYERRVSADNVVAFAGHKLQLPPGPSGSTYASRRVQLLQGLDNHLRVLFADRPIAHFPPLTSSPPRVDRFDPRPQDIWRQPAEPPASSEEKRIYPPPKPPADHPWRRYGKSLHVRRKLR